MTGEETTAQMHEIVDKVFRSESRRVLATLIRLLCDFDLAEDAMHDAFAAALAQWPKAGMPTNPRAWLVSVGRFKAIDALRRRARLDAALGELANQWDADRYDPVAQEFEAVEDDRLRLIFTCCHPALAPEARIALTLREVCSLTTEEIAHAFLTGAPTVAQRIVRAKAKIKSAPIPYQIPSHSDLPDRLDCVLRVIYLVFHAGYSASLDAISVPCDLAREAIRLARLLIKLLPEPEAKGLLALMLLHDSRRAARVSPSGDLILLEDQDRSLWNRKQIVEGVALVEQALCAPGCGPYTLQAAIAAVHAEAASAAATDWAQIVALYDLLAQREPSPIVALNRAVAIAMCHGPAAGLASIDCSSLGSDLADYPLMHAARADLCRRLGKIDAARAAYAQALRLTRRSSERRFLTKRLAELPAENSKNFRRIDDAMSIPSPLIRQIGEVPVQTVVTDRQPDSKGTHSRSHPCTRQRQQRTNTMNEVIGKTKEDLLRSRERSKQLLATTPDDKVNWSPSPTARTPIQLVAHSALAVTGIQEWLSGKPFPFENTAAAEAAFRAADKEFTTREQALTQLEQACAGYLAWLDALTPEQLDSTFQTFMGPVPFAVAITFPVDHMRMHAAQIEYIQTIYGDHDWHM